MAIEFTCKGCGKKLKATDAMSDKTIKCPECKTPLRVPNPSANIKGDTESEGGLFEMEELHDEPAEDMVLDTTSRPVTQEEKRFKMPSKQLLKVGIRAGIMMGAVIMLIIGLVDYGLGYLLGSGMAYKIGIVRVVIFCVLDGVVLGAITSTLMVFTNSLKWGIFAGAFIVAGPSIIRFGFGIFTIFPLTYGIILGYWIASATAKVISSVELDE